MELLIKRTKYETKQTLGTMQVIEDGEAIFTCYTLELADKNNAPKVSCIPKGSYTVVKRTSAKYGHHFHILDVPNRSYILIHHGNYHTDILGCVLVGNGHVDINGDGLKDVISSKATMKKLLLCMPEKFTLTIK